MNSGEKWVVIGVPLVGPSNNTCYLTATPPADSWQTPPLQTGTLQLLELNHERVDSGGWVRVLYDVHDGKIETDHPQNPTCSYCR
jgi:hypothetical protein